MVGKSRGLPVGLVTDVTRVGFVVGVNHVVFVQAGVFSESFVASNDLTDIWPFPCMEIYRRNQMDSI